MEKTPRNDTVTAQRVREAQAMQRAFGDHAAQTFLKQRHVSEEVARRVLEHPEQRRQF